MCVALGLWLGAMAIAASLWLAQQLWPQQVQPLAQVVAPHADRPVATPAPATAQDAQAEMFERYKDILHKQELEQAADAARLDPSGHLWSVATGMTILIQLREHGESIRSRRAGRQASLS